MELLPPCVLGPLSECNRAVRFDAVLPGATVVVVRTRAGHSERVGTTIARLVHGEVALDPSQSLLAGDLVTAYQHDAAGSSPWQPDAVEVQVGVGDFNPPQVLTHLYSCSRGFTVGGVRPGARLEVLHGGTPILTGTALDGVAHLRALPGRWLPNAGQVLTLRQRVCPSPPPPGGAPEWVIDHALPPVEPMLSAGGELGETPAPRVVAGHTDCSRAVTVEDVLPGAEVVVEDRVHGWWATWGPSDATSGVVPLPVRLREGEEFEVRQEFECRTTSERLSVVVGLPEPLGQPRLAQIDCHTTTTVSVAGTRPGADLEVEVAHQGSIVVFRGIATAAYGPVPAPPMPAGAVVRVRQGECDRWSPWSEPRTANVLAQPVSALRIVGDLFHCQNSVTVENVFPLAGTLVVRSDAVGELARVVGFGNVETIKVAPSLVAGHEVVVEHRVCGQSASDRRTVRPGTVPRIGEIEQPYDGDTAVVVEDVMSDAYLEIRDQDGRLGSGYAPASTDGRVAVAIGVSRPLAVGQHVHAVFWHCGHYGRTDGRPVVLRKPVLTAVQPASVSSPSSDPTTFLLVGQHFRPGAMLWFEGAGLVSTTFLSSTEVRGNVPGYHFDTPRTAQVLVRNPDGQFTGLLDVRVVAAPEPEPEPEPGPGGPGVPEAESVAVFQCSTEHRDVHVWQRDLTAGTGWQLVGTLEHQYDAGGTCAPDGEPAETIDLDDGHDYALAAVDPLTNGCIPPGGDPAAASPPAGTPDLVNQACVRAAIVVRGRSGAGEKPWSIG